MIPITPLRSLRVRILLFRYIKSKKAPLLTNGNCLGFPLAFKRFEAFLLLLKSHSHVGLIYSSTSSLASLYLAQ